MYVVKAFSRIGNQAFCSTQALSLKSLSVYILLPWLSVHIAHAQRNERAYLSSIWIYMLGNVCFTHRKMGDGRQLCLSLIFQYSSAVIGPFPSPQGLSVWLHILGTGTINIRDQRVFIMQFVMSILGWCRTPPFPPYWLSVWSWHMLYLHNWVVALLKRQIPICNKLISASILAWQFYLSGSSS